MNEQPAWQIGQRVCVIGFGTAGMLHEHHEVVRLTKLYVISAKPGATWTRRHRLDSGRSSPGGTSYGGTDIYPTCQQPKTGK